MFHLLAQTPHITVEALMGSLALIWLGRMLADLSPWLRKAGDASRTCKSKQHPSKPEA